ncbi:Transcriptional regulator, GntR family domain / Aspartate aminotransferase, partial [hydrothermal vent metagenome]
MAVQFRDKNSQRVTLVTQVMQEVHQRIANRRLVPGAKLPSIRKFAQIMQVSKSTVVDAYDRL